MFSNLNRLWLRNLFNDTAFYFELFFQFVVAVRASVKLMFNSLCRFWLFPLPLWMPLFSTQFSTGFFWLALLFTQAWRSVSILIRKQSAFKRYYFFLCFY